MSVRLPVLSIPFLVGGAILGSAVASVAEVTPGPAPRLTAQVPRDTIDVPSTPLEAAAVEFARGWAESSSRVLLPLMAPEIRLQLSGSGRSGLSPRQAVAAVEEFLRPYRRGGTVVSRAAALDSSPDRGFAEILWSAMAVGTADTSPNTVFVGLIRLDGDWKVDEIRLLP